MPKRPSWDVYFMDIAKAVSTRSTCRRRSVGAVIVKDRRILTTGYNGSPRGLPHCEEFGCDVEQRCQLAAHAEMNAIAQAALNGVSCDGGTLYVTCQPCSTCAKLLINAGIKRIVFEGDYPDDLALTLFGLAGTELVRLRGEASEVLGVSK